MKSGTETRKTTGTGTVGIKPAMKFALFPRPLKDGFISISIACAVQPQQQHKEGLPIVMGTTMGAAAIRGQPDS